MFFCVRNDGIRNSKLHIHFWKSIESRNQLRNIKYTTNVNLVEHVEPNTLD